MNKIIATAIKFLTVQFLSGYRTYLVVAGNLIGGMVMQIDESATNDAAGVALITTAIGLLTARRGSKNDAEKAKNGNQ